MYVCVCLEKPEVWGPLSPGAGVTSRVVKGLGLVLRTKLRPSLRGQQMLLMAEPCLQPQVSGFVKTVSEDVQRQHRQSLRPLPISTGGDAAAALSQP